MDILEKGNVLAGDIFKSLLFGQRFIKVVEDDNKEDYNTVLKPGFNERKIEVNNNSSINYGGIKFSSIDNFHNIFTTYNNKHEYYWDIDIPDDAIIAVETDYYKSDKIILLGIRRQISDLEVWNDRDFCLMALNKNKQCMKYIKNLSQDLQIEFVKKERNNIKLIDNPSEEVCISHVGSHFNALCDINNQTDKIVLTAIKKSKYNFKDIKCMTEDLALEIVKIYPDLFKELKRQFQTEKVMLEVLLHNINYIKDMEYQTQKVVDYVLSKNLSLLKFLDKHYISKETYYAYFEEDVTILENMPNEYQNDEMCYKAVKEVPTLISYVLNKTDDISWCAIKKNPSLIKYVSKPSKEMIKFAHERCFNIVEYIQNFEDADDEIVEMFIDRKPELIKYCTIQTDNLCKRCLKNDGMILEHIHKKTPELCSIATKQNYNAIQFVDPDMITSDMYIEPLKNNPRLLKDIPFELQTEDLCLDVVKKDGLALEYVLNQTYKICKEAINNDSEAIKFVDKKILDEELCWLAAKKKGSVMEFIPEELQTQNVCMAAIRNYPYALQFIFKKSPGLCKEAFDRNMRVIKFIPFPTEEMWIQAVKKFNDLAEEIENPSFELMIEIVKVRPFLVTSFVDPPEEVIIEAIKKNYRIYDRLEYHQQTEKIQEELIKEQHQDFDKIYEPTVNMMMIAVKKDYSHIERLKEIHNVISDEDYEKICLAAIDTSWLAMQHIEKKNRNICLAGVRKNGLTLEYIEEEFQTEEIINEAIANFPNSIKEVINKSVISETAATSAIIHNGILLEYIENQTEDLCCLAVNDNYSALRFVKNQTDRIIREALSKNCLALEYVINKKEEYCMEPVCEKPWLIRHLTEEEQTEAICYIALSSDPSIIQHIKNPTLDMYIKALSKDGLLIKHVKEEKINDHLCIIAINENPTAIKHINDQSKSIAMMAIKKDPTLIEFIKNKTEEMILYALSKNPSSFSKINYQYEELCYVAGIVNPKCIPYIKDLDTREQAKILVEKVINLKILD